MQKNNEKALESLEFQGYRRLAGMGFEPHDLRVMSYTGKNWNEIHSLAKACIRAEKPTKKPTN